MREAVLDGVLLDRAGSQVSRGVNPKEMEDKRRFVGRLVHLIQVSAEARQWKELTWD